MDHIPFSQKPSGSFPTITHFPHPDIYKTLKEEGISKLLRAVYGKLAQSPIAALFPQDKKELEAAADRSSLFFVTVCGGPALYEERYGPPRMRARHVAFKIDEAARLHWLACWDAVLETAPEEIGFPAEHRSDFRAYLESFSSWMVNS